VKRICAITLLLAVAMLCASPTLALALTNHACCVPQAAAKTAKPARSNAGGKHAHCAAMAAKASAQESATSNSEQLQSVYPRHKCGECALGAMSAPRDAAAVSIFAQACVSCESRISAIDAQVHALQASVLRDNRGPPSSSL
jgi:hypothetical protein